MADLSTRYLGLTLGNPIIVASSGLTNNVADIKELEKNGAGAVVLKSLFEEQILLEADYKLKKAGADDMLYTQYSETLDYIDLHIKEKTLTDYLQMIKNLKNEILIPVIASINCVTSQEWTSFARRIEEAGADALELNIFIMPFNFDGTCTDNEKIYFEITEKVKKEINIPVAVKISPYFSNLGQVIEKLSGTGIEGIVLFNRFASIDIDVENKKVIPAFMFSNPSEISLSLRWIAIMSNRVNCDLVASTGIHDGDAVIKQLLAGATAVQVASAIYKNGPGYIVDMITRLEKWMQSNGYNYIEQFKGKLSQSASENPDAYERIQFMKYFSEIR